MIIKRIKAVNYKTYLNLDLNLEPEQDRPIILIGGQNGGGKSTLFESIYGALYGLNITKAKDFDILFNNGNKDFLEKQIMLEIHFVGKVLNEMQTYVLTRVYKLNESGQVIENVKLNMNGDIFNYNSAEPVKTRSLSESNVNKLIRANLPKELSKYFLFDAMESGTLLKDDQLAKVIKENIDNVMGFNKYNQLAKCSTEVYQSMTAQKFKAEKDKTEYTRLISTKNIILSDIESQESLQTKYLNYLSSHEETYKELKNNFNQEESLKERISKLKSDNETYKKNQAIYRSNLEVFVKELELNIGLPMLASTFNNVITDLLEQAKEIELKSGKLLTKDLTEQIILQTITYLKNHNNLSQEVSIDEIYKYIENAQTKVNTDVEANKYNQKELSALQKLINTQYNNQFTNLVTVQTELNNSFQSLSKNKSVIEELQKQISLNDFTLIKDYEQVQTDLNETKASLKTLKEDLKKVEKELSQYDISEETEPDPRYELVKKLNPFFIESIKQLLLSKKKMIEQTLVADLNINLIPYKNMIERVEFGNDMKDFTFRMYHQTGNEISLNLLNTASKQMVVQCLLKALHKFGDYNPPVMIDTVMGVLDEQSRETVLENYFPQLSHQTILLSSDSEIRVNKDLDKLKPYICRAYTVKRDIQKQKSDIYEGYFGVEIN